MIAEIALDLIDPPREDDRIERSPEAIARLAADIAANTLIHPPTVRRQPRSESVLPSPVAGTPSQTVHPGAPRYECVAGWTRILALRLLGHVACLCSVLGVTDDRTASRIRLAENLQRENLSPIEEGIRLSRIVAAEQLSVHAIADLVHRSPEWVAQRLNLLAIPDDLQAHVHTRALAIASALALGQVTDAQHRGYLLQYALDAGATVDTVRAWVSEWRLHQASGSPDPAALPPMPIANVPHTVTIPCARCHAPHDIANSCIIRVCQECGRAIERELRHPLRGEASQ